MSEKADAHMTRGTGMHIYVPSFSVNIQLAI